MPYAYNSDGIVISIADAENKNPKIRFNCIECEERVIPRKGEFRSAHFRHFKEDSSCKGITYTHQLAPYLVKELGLSFPQ